MSWIRTNRGYHGLVYMSCRQLCRAKQTSKRDTEWGHKASRASDTRLTHSPCKNHSQGCHSNAHIIQAHRGASRPQYMARQGHRHAGLYQYLDAFLTKQAERDMCVGCQTHCQMDNNPGCHHCTTAGGTCQCGMSPCYVAPHGNMEKPHAPRIKLACHKGDRDQPSWSSRRVGKWAMNFELLRLPKQPQCDLGSESRQPASAHMLQSSRFHWL